MLLGRNLKGDVERHRGSSGYSDQDPKFRAGLEPKLMEQQCRQVLSWDFILNTLQIFAIHLF